MQLANHHAHSHFSDGRLSPEEYIRQALAQNLTTYGFSDHAPIPGSSVGLMELEQQSQYLAEIERLQGLFGDRIQIYKGLEVDYIPGVISMASEHIQAAGLDYIIGAVHFVDQFADGQPWGFEGSAENFERGIQEIFQGDVQAAIERYYDLIQEMVKVYQPTIVAHLDRIKKRNENERYFSEKAPWYRKKLEETLEVIAASGSIMEVNTKGYYKGETAEPYPGRWAVAKAKEMGIPVHLGSDAHHPNDITKGFDFASSILEEVGYENIHILLDGGWVPMPLKTKRVHSTPS